MRILLFTAGIILLSLGVIGAFLPLLPTTPFVLLATWLFGKSSPRFHNYLLRHRIFGQVLTDFYEKKALRVRTKVIALASMWAVLFTTSIFFMPYIWARVAVFAIGAAVTVWILRYPTLRDNS